MFWHDFCFMNGSSKSKGEAFMKIKSLLYSFSLVVLMTGSAFAAELPKVTILATGGTIAGAAPSSTQLTDYKAGELTAQQLIDAVPSISSIAQVSAEQIANTGSGNLTFEHWLKLAKRANELLASDACDGIVVTHGTDTLEETAYFLNLVVKSDKPVVLVGAMRPATAISADGPLNLLNAVGVAGSPESCGKGVLVVMNGQINAAREVTKTNTLSVETFKTPDFGMLGYVIDYKPVFYRAPVRKHTKDTEFDVSKLTTLPRVDIAYQTLGGDVEMHKASVSSGAQGLVEAGSGCGSLSNVSRAVLTEASKKGLIVVRSSRTGSGMVTPSSRDAEPGFLTADNLNPQKARVLLMLALTVTKDKAEIQRMFATY